MKNKTPYIVIAIAFILFNVIAFAIPTEKASVFWIGYVFTVVAFAVQAFVWHLTIGKKAGTEKQVARFICGIYQYSISCVAVHSISDIYVCVSSPELVCNTCICIDTWRIGSLHDNNKRRHRNDNSY